MKNKLLSDLLDELVICGVTEGSFAEADVQSRIDAIKAEVERRFDELREQNETLYPVVCLSCEAVESENVRLKDLCRDLTAALEAAPVYGGRTNAEGEWGREVVERDALIARARGRA